MNVCEWDGGKVEFRELACRYALFVLRHLSCRETVGFVHNSINVSVGFCSHLNHVGAPPYFTEVCGDHGPSYMTVCYIHCAIMVVGRYTIFLLTL